MEPWIAYIGCYAALNYLWVWFFSPRLRMREYWLAFSGVAMCAICFFGVLDKSPDYTGFGLTFGLSLFIYVMYYFFGSRTAFSAILMISVPIGALVLFKCEYFKVGAGFSYFAFRTAYLAYEYHTGRIAMPGLIRYLGFVFFPLTFMIGPINPFHTHEKSLLAGQRPVAPMSRCFGRILVGIWKCYFIAVLFQSLSFAEYWATYYEHNLSDFVISCIATTLYIYFNFSGACDMFIGAAALMGIRVQENFNNPLLSRNLQLYWSRNHITLTQVVRELCFTPGILMLARVTRGRYMLVITSLMSVVAILIVAVWHGNQFGYVLFGLMHGIGLVCVNLYTEWLRRAPAAFQRFSASKPAAAFSWLLTFMYVSSSSVFFGSSKAALLEIWSKLVL
jgi:D-alanyl-lipoteichoic acid acyltransferase DltB (MBOAT superfamily)